ncbi:MAG: hypothetical protein KDE56_26000 [Anaerolineales bacterium]|nr:hypothetical protein [Anaerolineales bacterium]
MSNRYIPALSFKWLTPLYDPLLKWGMDEENFKRKLIRQANIQPRMNILDLGCGTGLMTKYIRRLEQAADNFDGLIPLFVTEAGFGSVNEAEHFVTIFGPLSLWRAVKG